MKMRLPVAEPESAPRRQSRSGSSSDGRRSSSNGSNGSSSSSSSSGSSGSGASSAAPHATPAAVSKLQLQCSDGRVFDVTHEEAMMSSTLWMLLQDVMAPRAKSAARQHMIPIFDVPSASVELALSYCRCLYKAQVEGDETAMLAWEDQYFSLDSKTLCDLAKVASNLDIQPLVDVTCRSIAQIMSATEAAHEIRQKFGLDDAPSASECSCGTSVVANRTSREWPGRASDGGLLRGAAELQGAMTGFDFDVFTSLDHDLSTEDYELVEFDQPSVDELVNFINGDSSTPSAPSQQQPQQQQQRGGRPCHVHGSDARLVDASGAPANKKKRKKKKKKKHSGTTASTHSSSARQPSDGDPNDDDDDEDDDVPPSSSSSSPESATRRASTQLTPEELREKMRLAQTNPSAVFQESQFEDDDDEELELQLESFRLALESAHRDSKPEKLKPRLQFAPQDVFRSHLESLQSRRGRLSEQVS
ncbi:hypothetical protein P43SY_001300 [Pythium insidiosum]|uniref:SKP1 component POZ domain-containing protein n=1 Tax=Pythium insidiosum TaxID=114742 RepID=A0AAD5LHW6_PYTIN|nr:hypothetical protein P43SY_001300 [Pythium insidiosum]